jgi:hypothetical protein
MQELLIPDVVASPGMGFDDYKVVLHQEPRINGHSVVLMTKADANAKRWWLVLERTWSEDERGYVTHDVKEFKHAEDRARRYYERLVRG